MRIDSLPTDGQLTLNGQAIAALSAVSIDDINAGNLVYLSPIYRPSNPLEDWVQHISFRVSDGHTRFSTASSFDFYIAPPDSTKSNPVWTGDKSNPLDESHKGSSKADLMIGYGGKDTLSGLGGNDQIFGGDRDDNLNGRAGGDYLSGAVGNDVLTGGAGNDFLRGGDGNDTLFGGNGKTAKQGLGSGGDVLNGGAGGDRLYGGNGKDLLIGGAGSDTVDGGAGSDTVDGGAGSDTVDGGAGKDIYGYLTTQVGQGDILAGNQDTVIATRGDIIAFVGGFLSKLPATSLGTGIDADHPLAFIPGSGNNPG